MSDIVERLCAVESSEVCETTRTTTNWHRNPDGPEAADEITRLRAENERLRELLTCWQDADLDEVAHLLGATRTALQGTGDE